MPVELLVGPAGGSERWELLTVTATRFEADVLAARLWDEGLESRLRHGIGAAYGLTIGSLAAVEVFVPETHLADARLVLLAGDVDAAFPDPDAQTPNGSSTPRHPAVWRIAAGALLVGAALPVLRLLI